MSAREPSPPFPIVAWLESRTTRQRRVALVIGTLGIVALIVRWAARVALDRLWFHSVTTADVWGTAIRSQLTLALLALVVGMATVAWPVWRASALSPADDGEPSRAVLRYRSRMSGAHEWLVKGIAILLVFRGAGAAMSRWQPWLLFVHGPSLGVQAPELGGDLGFHLFRLPFLTLALSWSATMILWGLAVSVFAAVANGALRLPIGGRRSSPDALGLVGGSIIAFCVVRAVMYIAVVRPQLATIGTGTFDGPGYTELHVQAVAVWLVAAAALMAGGLTIFALRTSSNRPAVWGFAAWGTAHVLALVAIPALVQALLVAPAEGERELPFIAHNLEATRTAFALEDVEVDTRPLADGVTATAADDETIDRLPVFGEEQLVTALQVLTGTPATRITDVDLDRYPIDGELRPVLLAARNSSRADLPERGWVQEHLVYTHGDGVVAVPADRAGEDGRPDVSALADLTPMRPELYFGEGLGGWYAIVGTDRTEQGGAAFAADTGIALDSVLRRLQLSMTVGEIEPLFSSELTGRSQLLLHRDIRERVSLLAPFLALDGNWYPVVTDDRIVWVGDGYTTASTYPYAQRLVGAALPQSSDLAGGRVNYLRASVKVTVDGYDGTIHLYRTELGASDPILDTWQRILPGLVEDIEAMPGDIRSHLLYPQDFFTAQTAMLGRYHVTDPETLFSGADSWAVSAAPGAGVALETSGPSPAVSMFMPPGHDRAGQWVALRPFSPGASDKPTSTRDELAALAIGSHDTPQHITVIAAEQRPGRQVASPLVAQSAIDTDRSLASEFTLLNANGSLVSFGPMTPVPLRDGVAWMRSIIVTGTAGTTTPRLYGVAAVSAGVVGVGPDPSSALAGTVASAG